MSSNNLTALETKVYNAMLESCEYEIGDGWAQIYLDNARPDDINARQFAAILSSLEQKGLYKSQGDNFFGLVFQGAAA
jgi:hypothetical protein